MGVDLSLEFIIKSLKTRKCERLGSKWDQHNGRGERDDRGDQLNQARRPINGIVERPNIEEVRESTRDDECAEHPEDDGKWDIAAASDEVNQYRWDGHVGQPNDC